MLTRVFKIFNITCLFILRKGVVNNEPIYEDFMTAFPFQYLLLYLYQVSGSYPQYVLITLIYRRLRGSKNQETPISFIENEIVNNNLFYKRNHFNYPALSYSNYWLPINGIMSTPILLSMEDILQLPSKTILAVLECSGDKRNLFEPKVFGEQWEKVL